VRAPATVLDEDSICDLHIEQIRAGGTHLFARDAAEPVDRFGVVIDEATDDGARVDDDVRRYARDRDPSG